MKGIILAGGEGTRLYPLTKVTSKQLLPVYNKPMIFYPLETLLKAGIKDILIIIAPDRAGDFLRLLGSGKEFGARFTYEIQDKPEGIAQAFLIGKNFIGNDNVTLILGDNIFENNFNEAIREFQNGALLFVKEVGNPERFGVVSFDKDGRIATISEKPKNPKSKFAVTGLYVYDNSVIAKTKSLKPSDRHELEITDLNNLYLQENTLQTKTLTGRWFDAGTFESLLEASNMASEISLRNTLS